MEEEWKCQIFTVELLKKVLEKIQKAYKLKEEMSAEVQNILNRDGVNRATRFLWILSNAYDEAFEIVKRVHKE